MKKIENYSQIERYISPLYKTLSEEGKKKLVDILDFWAPLKEKWAEARKKFWSKYDRDQFLLQLRHAEKKREELIKENHQKLEGIWFFTRWKKKQEKFISEYLKALSYYGEIMKDDEQEEERTWEDNEDEREDNEITLEEVQESGFREWVILDLRNKHIWEEWAKAIAEAISKMELKEWVILNLEDNDIWAKWAEAIAEAISNMELKEWVRLDFGWNSIWAKWAEALAKMELKERVTLNLSINEIWDDWAEELSNMELKEWVRLDFGHNNIWDRWAKAIAKNLKLKEWVTLELTYNKIWNEWATILKNWVADARARGINCKVNF